MRETPKENPDDVQVRLKPFLGMEPTTYLPVLYGLVTALVLFLLLLLPGIVKPGAVLTVTSTPANAAVSIDGTILGASGEKIFVPAGNRQLTVSKPGHVPYEETLEFGRRLVASLIVPRRETIKVSLDAVSPTDLIATAMGGFAEWSLVGEASGQYQLPPLARELGVDLGVSGNGAAYAQFFPGALAQVNSEAGMNDLLAGALLAEAGGLAPGPHAVAAVLQSLALVASGTPGLAIQMDEITSGLRRESINASAWAAAAGDELAVILAAERIEPADSIGRSTTIEGMVFVTVPAGSGLVGGNPRAERGGDIPYVVDLPQFRISQTEVTVGSYARFTQARSEWALDNRETLVDSGLVDGDYLRDWEEGVPTATLPVTYVSAFAAEAFAAWFSSQPGVPADARLPTEAEWDYVAALDTPESGVLANTDAGGPAVVGESFRGSLGLYGVAGNVWEWTADPFAAYSRYYDPGTVPREAPHSVVRGGGWATPAGDFTLDDRGSMPREWCSPAVGFRLVVAE